MKTTEKQNELIHKYLRDKLEGEELELFLGFKDLPHFKEELLNQARIIDSLNQVDEDIVREELLKGDKTLKPIKTKNVKSLKPLLRALSFAALFGFFIAVIWLVSTEINPNQQNSEAERLIAMHNVAYPVQDF